MATKKMPPPPMQPLMRDIHGVIRFRRNRIVRYLLDNGSLDLNMLAEIGDRTGRDDDGFSQADWTQFYQLIGYSLSGFHELSGVADEDALAASREAQKQWPTTGGCRDNGCTIHCGVKKEEADTYTEGEFDD